MSWKLGVQKNPKIIVLVIIFVALGFVATLLASQCSFFEKCIAPNYDPALVLNQQWPASF